MSPLPRHLHRRQFVALATVGAAGLALGHRAFAGQDGAQGGTTSQPAAPGAPAKAATPLRILILGGTAFLGPEVVEAAQTRGHSVTLFNRGKTRPELFPNLEKLRGDRDPGKDEGLKSLEGREWDVVVDNSGYYPRHVKASAELLAGKVGQYIYISSISAFKEGAPANSNESFPVATLDDPTVETMGEGFTNYGGLKALGEQAAEAAMPGRVTNIRPGFIVGPGDWTGRFSYWPLRARLGGEMLGPGTPQDPVQWIDVRDLAEWIVLCAEKKVVGLFSATGPKPPSTMGEVISESIRVAKETAGTGSSESTLVDATVTWVPADFLQSLGVSAGGDLPIWIPPQGEAAGFHQWNIDKAVAAGLRFRSLDETIRGIYTWIDGLKPEQKGRLRPAGMTRDREAEVLKAWKSRPAG